MTNKWVIVTYGTADGKHRRTVSNSTYETHSDCQSYIQDCHNQSDAADMRPMRLDRDADGYYLPASKPTYPEIRNPAWNGD